MVTNSSEFLTNPCEFLTKLTISLPNCCYNCVKNLISQDDNAHARQFNHFQSQYMSKLQNWLASFQTQKWGILGENHKMAPLQPNYV